MASNQAGVFKASISSKLILKAAEFAALKHRDQRRKDVEASPYINHPISVALLIAEVGGVDDPEVLAAALLHDTLEDTDTTAQELEAEFGPGVRSLVEEVTDDKHLPKAARKKRQIEHAANISKGAVLIKLADKIANVQDITRAPPLGWDVERRKEYLAWAQAVIDNCTPVNPSLERRFADAVAQGHRSLAGTNHN